MRHLISTNAANANAIAKVNKIAAKVLQQHLPAKNHICIETMTPDGLGCIVTIYGNGALLRDMVNALDQKGWID